MKLIVLFVGLILCLFSFGQNTDTIYVGFNKSAWLIFDGPVKFDAGSQDIVVRNPDNKIIIQAAVEGFEETNLLVECNNEFFVYIVMYKENPVKSIYSFQKSAKTELVEKTESSSPEVSKKVEAKEDKAVLKDYSAIEKKEAEEKKNNNIKANYNEICIEAAEKKQSIFNRGGVFDKMTVKLENLFLHENEFYYVLSFENKSQIEYQMDYLGFFVRDKDKIKKIGMQDVEITANYAYNNVDVIKGKTKVQMVFVLNKLVLGKDKKINIEVWENNGDLTDEGGRKMMFSLYHKEILNIKSI